MINIAMMKYLETLSLDETRDLLIMIEKTQDRLSKILIDKEQVELEKQ